MKAVMGADGERCRGAQSQAASDRLSLCSCLRWLDAAWSGALGNVRRETHGLVRGCA